MRFAPEQAPGGALWCLADEDEDGVGVGCAVRDGVTPVPPAPARPGPVLLGPVLLGPVLLDTVLLGMVPGVADPEPGTGGAE
jgi:hypothetical protein